MSADAEIFDRGYRLYDGPRNGITTSMRSIFIASVQRALGLRRKFRFKVVPIVAVVLAYIPALGFLMVSSLFPAELVEEVLPEYAGYFGLIGLSMSLLTAFVAPELLSADRQTGMLGLYLASPLRVRHYLIAKGGALGAVLSLVTLFPVFFLMVGYSLLGVGPDGFGGVIATSAKILLAGAIGAIFYALLGMAGATLSKRQGFAAAGIVLAIIASAAFAAMLVELGGAPEWLRGFDLAQMPFDLIARLFDEPVEQTKGLSTLQSLGIYLGALGVFATIIIAGYRRIEVTK